MEHECGSFAVRLRVLIRAAWRRPEPARWSIGPHITGPMEHWAGWGRAVGWYASGWRQWRGEYCGTGQYRACLEGSAGPRVRSVESASDLLRSLLPRLPHGHHRLQSGPQIPPKQQHRWNIGVVIAAAMFHRCRAGPAPAAV